MFLSCFGFRVLVGSLHATQESATSRALEVISAFHQTGCAMRANAKWLRSLFLNTNARDQPY